MVRIPYIKIPSVRVGSIVPTSNIGTGGATPAPPTPITYLTQWKIVGNSEVHGNEIWSCGEYNLIDGKYHILVQPQGGSIVDIALTEPLRKINNVVDTIEFPSGTEVKALVTRNILSYLLENLMWIKHGTENRYYAVIKALNCVIPSVSNTSVVPLILCNKYTTVCHADRLKNDKQLTAIRSSSDYLSVMDSDLTSGSDIQGEILLQLATPTTELVDAPQIEEADSYSMVISQGGKAVEWSSFITNSE